MSFFRKRPEPEPPHPWSPKNPLLHFNPKDKWRINDAFQGVHIFGATGSGKTSGSGQALAKAFLGAGFGGLVLTAKTDEVDLWRKYAQATGAESRLVVFSSDSPYRFNFMEYECRRPEGRQTANLVSLFYSILEAITAEKAGSSDGYWEFALRQLLRNAIDLVMVAEDSVNLAAMKRVVASAPKTTEEVDNEAWQNRSYCIQCIVLGEERIQSGMVSSSCRNDFEEATRYWLEEFPALSERTRSIIVNSFTSMVDSFTRGQMREVFCTSTTIVPEDCLDGKVIVLNFPVKECGEEGRHVQMVFKYLWQGAMERRKDRPPRRPAFLWADEAQFFISPQDYEFQGTARGANICTVYLTQSISSYYAALRNRDRVLAFLGNLNTKIFHCNSDTATNEWAADMIARSWRSRATVSSNQEDSKDKSSVSVSQALEHDVIPQTFTRLRKGGEDNNRIVDGILFHAGQDWSNGKTYLKLQFPQDQP